MMDDTLFVHGQILGGTPTRAPLLLERDLESQQKGSYLQLCLVFARRTPCALRNVVCTCLKRMGTLGTIEPILLVGMQRHFVGCQGVSRCVVFTPGGMRRKRPPRRCPWSFGWRTYCGGRGTDLFQGQGKKKIIIH